MKSHLFWMILGCALSLLLIFLSPLLGIQSNWGILLLVILCFASHLFMMRNTNHDKTNNRHSSH